MSELRAIVDIASSRHLVYYQYKHVIITIGCILIELCLHILTNTTAQQYHTIEEHETVWPTALPPAPNAMKSIYMNHMRIICFSIIVW